MYTIYNYHHDDDDLTQVGGGQTRFQVLRDLERLELFNSNFESCDFPLPPLPRFGRELHICRPLCDPRGSILIKNV